MRDKQAEFIRIAEKRTNKAINDIKQIAMLSNTQLYRYTEAQVEKIFTALEEKIAESKEAFCRHGNTRRFTLEEK